jgi:uncharacterized protein
MKGNQMELSPYYTKQVECLHCRKKFNTTKIRSKFVKLHSQESDFQPIYANDINPLYYYIMVCEHCGFSYTEDFSKYFAPAIKEQIDAQISSKWVNRSYGEERTVEEAIAAYKLAYLSGTIKKEKSITLAGITLRTAWLYRNLGDVEQEKRFLYISRDLYIESYSQQDYEGTQMSEERVLYMIAELSRRLGDLEESTRYFSRVIEKQKTSIEPKVIEMAKEQWRLIREQKEIS